MKKESQPKEPVVIDVGQEIQIDGLQVNNPPKPEKPKRKPRRKNSDDERMIALRRWLHEREEEARRQWEENHRTMTDGL